MKRTILILVALLTLPAMAEPHFIAERQVGLKLVQSGKHAEAAAFFVKLAETAPKPEQKSDALRQAALAAARNKQIDEALVLAERIPLKPESHFAKVQIYLEARKWAELLKAAEMLDAATWPDGLIYPTLMARARAHSALGEVAAAEGDALLAIKHTISLNNQAAAWHLIAQNAQRAGNDRRKALEAYQQHLAGRGERDMDLAPAGLKARHPVWLGLRGKSGQVEARGRSEERRVGKECRSRWSPYH